MKLKAPKIFLTIIFFLTNFSTAHALSITCSLFPVYDFARNVAPSADVKLILKPGVEPHEFEPSPLDVKALNDADVFIFTGPQMEHWAERISRTLTNTKIIDASKNISLVNDDPHVWLDLSLSQKMIENILNGLCEIAPEQKEFFTDNAKKYCEELSRLDEKFSALEKNRALVFAGEFSCGYFVRRYGFDYVSAYDGENEPSVKKLAQVLKFIHENKTKYIFADAYEISRITLSISEQTNTEILIFNTAHNAGEKNSFLQVMSENYENVKRVLND